MNDSLTQIEEAIAPLRKELLAHRVYALLEDVDDIRLFMEKHVYAVWDFMSLLKALQQKLTCTTLPWRPAPHPKLARFINEIVLDEESDLSADGQAQSHFEMYLDAMREVGADTQAVLALVEQLTDLEQLDEVLTQSELAPAEQAFLRFTFSLIKEGKAHQVAAAFTFGREDILPDVFLAILREQKPGAYPQLTYYLERHIELDGDEHGPLALEMISELCGNDEQKWQEVTAVAQEAIRQRIGLWDEIAEVVSRSSAATLA